jgi:hypothetical protein
MKDNYNIKTNPPELSSEQISKHQDFDALFAQFQAAEVPPKDETEASTPVRSIKKGNDVSPAFKYGTGALMAVAAAILLVFMIRQSMSSGNFEAPLDQINEVFALQAPMPSIQKSFGNLVINAAERGETLNYESGSKIIVPASAFVDEKGKPVKGKVDIQYREFNDHVDMFLAGVPKEVDKHQNLQSVGMMEIKGFQDGKPVYLSMDKTLEVELQGRVAANIPISDLKVYVYGKQQDAWEYVTNDDVEVLAATDKNGTTIQKKVVDPKTNEKLVEEVRETLGKSKPKKPIKPGVGENMQIFNFDINEEDFPELVAYNQNVQLMAAANQMTAGTFDTSWNSMNLTGLGADKYRMKLVYETNEGNIVRTFEVYPAIEDTEEAKALYIKKLEEYDIRMKQWESDVLVEVEHLSAGETLADNVDWKEIINKFKINRFGLWNCGKEVEFEDALKVTANFVDENGAAIAVNSVFVTNKDKQLYYFAPNVENKSTAELKYEATAENKIWALTENNELLVVNNSSTKEDVLSFQMRSVGIVQTEEDIRNVLTF